MYNSCFLGLLDACLRRKRVGGRVYIHEWQSRAELPCRLGHGYGYTPGYPVNLPLDNYPSRFSWVSRCAWKFFVCIIRVCPEIRPSR